MLIIGSRRDLFVDHLSAGPHHLSTGPLHLKLAIKRTLMQRFLME